MLGFDLEPGLAGLTNPMVLSINESVIVNSLTIVCGAHVTLHS
jgi:hypothetical protein